MIIVYHQKLPANPETERQWDPLFGGSAPWPEQYVKVAEVETDDLDVAWQLTNHIESAWTENAGVTPTDEGFAGDDRHRSSMVGDVFEVSGKFYVVATCGFDLLEVE